MALLTIPEAAKKLRVGQNALYALCRRPDFPAVKLHAHAIRIPESELDAWIVREALKGRDNHDR